MSDQLLPLWQQLTDFITHRNSIDLGALDQLVSLTVWEYTPHDPITYAAQAAFFLETVSNAMKNRNKQQQQGQSLALLSLDALIYNLYKTVRTNQEFRPASSSLYGWLSSSQMSMSADLSELSSPAADREPKKVLDLIEALANSDQLFKQLRIILGRVWNQDLNQRFAQALVETLTYILEKEKRKKDTFLQLKGKLFSNTAPVRKRVEVDFKATNRIIFGSRLNQVISLLTSASDQTHMALLRIWWASRRDGERKQLQGRDYSGSEMLLNLHRYYIENLTSKTELFEASKHPVYRLLCNHQILFFSPTFCYFHNMIARLSKNSEESPFSKARTDTLQRQLSSFLGRLPQQLIRLLNQLYLLIEQIHPGGESATVYVKKLLFYSFLLDQDVIFTLMPNHDPSAHQETYTQVINAFFQSSKTKLEVLGKEALEASGKLIDMMSDRLDSIIMNPSQGLLQQEEEGGGELQFLMTEPILNHDYQEVALIVKQLKFTPMDMKDYAMRRQGQAGSTSPLYKHFSKDFSMQILPQETQQLDLATWMSVGGKQLAQPVTHQKKKPKKGVAERLSKFSTISKKDIQELDNLRSQFEQWLCL